MPLSRRTITARTLKGFRDFLPAQARERRRITGVIEKTFEAFGFLPLETPTLEYADVLTGKYGDEGEKLLYRFTDNGGRDVAMRYDLTVPLARVVAQYRALQKPFRRYQIAPVWRADNTQKGRFREFVQCDADVIGSKSMLADAEVILLYERILTALGVKNIAIRVNNRKLLNGLLQTLGITDEQIVAVLRSLDKWEKMPGVNERTADLERAVSKPAAEQVLALLPESADEEWGAWTDRIAGSLKQSKRAQEGADELRAVVDRVCKQVRNPQCTVTASAWLARGLDYYTGTIFEAVLPEKPEFGSVGGGGRYDELIGRFTGTHVPAVGMSLGIDRLMAAMEELGLLQQGTATARVFLPLLSDELTDDVFRLAEMLRESGIAVETAYEASKLEKQLKYADALGIPLVVLFGTKERAADTVVIKDLRRRTQKTVPRADAVLTVQGLLVVNK